jgi:hypothetical protein
MMKKARKRVNKEIQILCRFKSCRLEIDIEISETYNNS